jgi:hypothetical protein
LMKPSKNITVSFTIFPWFSEFACSKWVHVDCLLFNASCNVTLIMWNHVWGFGFLYRVELHMQFSSGGTTVVYQSQQKLYIGLLSYETSNYTWLTVRRDWGRCYYIDNNTNKCRLVPWWTFYSLNLASGSSKWNWSSRTWLFSSHPSILALGFGG